MRSAWARRSSSSRAAVSSLLLSATMPVAPTCKGTAVYFFFLGAGAGAGAAAASPSAGLSPSPSFLASFSPPSLESPSGAVLESSPSFFASPSSSGFFASPSSSFLAGSSFASAALSSASGTGSSFFSFMYSALRMLNVPSSSYAMITRILGVSSPSGVSVASSPIVNVPMTGFVPSGRSSGALYDTLMSNLPRRLKVIFLKAGYESPFFSNSISLVPSHAMRIG
mmetsp:Transcript_32661/g.47935  ORF Transcript_32661/g.47935 Transcript_32661/m.47935 type:complete len:225 (+) Transcript_32661:942-1616(+)